jgi:hypothetical protein
MVAAGAEQWLQAARLAGAAAVYTRVGDNALEPDIGLMRNEYDRHIATVAEALGEDSFRSAWADGVTTPLAMIVEELLAEEPVAGG